MPYRHILVPFDDSPLAQAALSLGAWLAWRGGGELDLVSALPHVQRVFTPRPVPGMARLEAAEDASDLARAKTELSMQAARVRGKGVSATGAAFRGEPVPVLLDYIGRFGIDLVVMGTHGRPLAERWLLGSVASDIARRSPVPVQPYHSARAPAIFSANREFHAVHAVQPCDVRSLPFPFPFPVGCNVSRGFECVLLPLPYV
jgi:nucleotide-binding universal stress UspA family protein